MDKVKQNGFIELLSREDLVGYIAAGSLTIGGIGLMIFIALL